MDELTTGLPTCCLLDLPDEALLLCIDLLDMEDVLRFRSSCQRIRILLDQTPRVWKKMLRIGYPSTFRFICKHLKSDQDFWRSMFFKRHLIQKTVNREIQEFSAEHFHRQNQSKIHAQEFLNKVQLTSSNDCMYHRNFVKDALFMILDSDPDKQLTDKYYARRLLYFIRTSDLACFWTDLKAAPYRGEHFRDFIEGLVAFAQWFQPQMIVNLEKVSSGVEHIAVLTLENLHMKRFNHPIFQQVRLKDVPIDSMSKFLFQTMPQSPPFSIQDCKDILITLSDTFYNELEFKAFKQFSHDCLIADYFYVNQVLKTRKGIPITLSVIYSAVAAKLGLLCLPINDSGLTCCHFAVDQSLFIDCLRSGALTEVDRVIRYTPPLQVFKFMARNLIYLSEIQDLEEPLSWHSQAYSQHQLSLELYQVLDVDDRFSAYSLCRLYLLLNINYREIREILDNLAISHPDVRLRTLKILLLELVEVTRKEELESLAKEPSLRGAFNLVHPETEVRRFGKFAIGMVMRHRIHDNTCVIYGWDPTYDTQSCIRRMRDECSLLNDKQPFYTVLVDDGSLSYEADENLIPCKPQRIANPLLGRYFMEFDEVIGYVPNSELSKKYPEDGAVQFGFQRFWKK